MFEVPGKTNTARIKYCVLVCAQLVRVDCAEFYSNLFNLDRPKRQQQR